MSQAAGLPVSDLTAYLTARKALMASRQGLFDAMRTYLRPEQRPDAERLGDLLAASQARVISEDDWVVNPVRGYLTVVESPAVGRPFRLSVLQQGFELRVGVRGSLSVIDRTALSKVFAHTQPILKERGADIMLDWHFDAHELYQNAQAFEDAVYKVGAIFEAALQILVPALTKP